MRLVALKFLKVPERLVLDLYTQCFLYSSQYGTRDAQFGYECSVTPILSIRTALILPINAVTIPTQLKLRNEGPRCSIANKIRG